jgi:hypothetical protein
MKMRLNPTVSPAARKPRKARRPAISRAVFETLEPRWLLSVDTVTNLNDSGPGSLRQTLANAASGDTIQFASGLNGDTIQLTSGEISITKNVTIDGPGNIAINPTDTSSAFNIDPGTTVTILGLTITAGDAGHIGSGGDIYNSGNLTLNDDTVSLGQAELGAGLYNNGGVVTILDSTFSNSEASQQGGAILNASGGSINITSTTFSGNDASEEAGGAICNENASLTLTGCTLTDNTAGTYGGGVCNFADGTTLISGTTLSSNAAGFWGGAIFNYIDADLTVTGGCTINSNEADGTFGGGLFNDQGTANVSGTSFTSNAIFDLDGGVGAGVASELGTLNLSNCTFTDNGDFAVVAGGGLYADDLSTTVSSCQFINNQAEYGGGIFQNSNDTLNMSGSTLADNTATDYGGGAYLAGIAYIDNSTFAGNQAEYGGGLISYTTLTMANCTISTNIATATSDAGGGIYANTGNTTLYNTIVSGNTLSDDVTPSDITGLLDTALASNQTPSSYNLIGTGGSGGLTNGVDGNQVGVSADLGPLQNNGGPTETMALLTGSPAINAGDNALALDANGNPLTTDQRGPGFPRIVGGTVDIGAYEVQSSQQSSVRSSKLIKVSSSPLQRSARLAQAPAVDDTAVPGAEVTDASAASTPDTPSEIRDAYGVEDIYFDGIAGTGAGQTIALIEAYNDPDIISDANTFSTDYGLPIFNSAGGPTLKVLGQTGTTSLPANGPVGEWDVEESLDVEWAHAIAPMANIIVFEANSAETTDLYTAIATAADTPGVSVVSMSFGSSDLVDYVGGFDEPANDSTFTTPAGHEGVTFLGAAGDDGAPDLGYPAASPNVIAVGGTTLTIGTDGSYLGETAWSGGGGGTSVQESEPSYQSEDALISGVRNAPDVSMDADPETGVAVIDSYDSPGSILQVGGTSLATPMWAALIAIVDQGLALRGVSSLNGATQTLPMLYALPSSDFHDITTGDDGFPATAGFDLATGLGSPIANLLVPALAGYPETAVWTGAQNNNWNDPNNWNILEVPTLGMNVVINSGNPVAPTGFEIADLTLDGGTLQLGVGSGSSVVTSLSITPTATLDVTNDSLYIDFGSAADPISTIVGYLTSGYNAGAWTGTGIDSSSAAANSAYALGYSDGKDGVVTGLVPGQIEIAYTLYGDANLDGDVNGVDFTILASHLNQSVTDGWDEGDFNYDGSVNGADFALLAENFNESAIDAAVVTAPNVAMEEDSSTSDEATDPNSTVDSAILDSIPAAPATTTTDSQTLTPANISTPQLPQKHHVRRRHG